MKYTALFFICVCPSIFFGQTKWEKISSLNGDIEMPNGGNQQTSCVVADFNNDGINDFAIGERSQTPSMVIYIRTAKGWDKYVVDAGHRTPEAGICTIDINGDDYPDIVAGGDYQSNEVWWYENPGKELNASEPWKRHIIKNWGATKHHDIMAIDIDHDGKQEIVFWNQGCQTLFFARIPDDPTGKWDVKPVYTYERKEVTPRASYKFNDINEHEGLDKADMDGDGFPEIVGGATWFKYMGSDRFEAHVIDETYHYSRCAAGQLIKGGKPEVILVVGDGVGPMLLYSFDQNSGQWQHKTVAERVDNGHSLRIADIDGDGNQDIWFAEMRLNGGNEQSQHKILYGDGQGNFNRQEIISVGEDLHESKIADLDGDGDFDIVGKGYDLTGGNLNIWLQNGTGKVIAAKTGAFRKDAGLQLYSLRADFNRDVEATLKQISLWGITEIEMSGYYGKTVNEWKELLRKYDLNCRAMTVDYAALNNNPEQLIADARTLGAKYIGVGWIPHSNFSIETVREAAGQFNRFGKLCKEKGIRFYYHPHGYEFSAYNGDTLMDEMMHLCDNRYVTFEIDFFWFQYAGENPARWLKKYPKRFELAHLKELRTDVSGTSFGTAPDETSVALGKGITHWPSLLQTAVANGCKIFYIEDESPNAPKQIKETLTYLKQLK